ncbi:hypothetical protein ACIRS1_02890 [Kitasatospora sp. NPDC101176]|uniref:hypothetical protein n=1 Tax=Kitasatospora sp. NPDC101176 TaxID=3364099 RepID=UPI00382B19DC
MTVPIEPEGATPGYMAPPLLADTIRLVAVSLPMTMVIAFVGIIWLIGAIIPPAHSNSQKTGRQAIEMIRIMARREAK